MIRNIIFDMGGVLVHYDPEHFVDLLSVSAEDKALLMREVFRTVAWFRMDRGTMGEAEAAASMKANLALQFYPHANGVQRLPQPWDVPVEHRASDARAVGSLHVSYGVIYKEALLRPEAERPGEHAGDQGEHLRHKGEGRGLLHVEQEKLIRNDPKVAQIVDKSEKSEEARIFPRASLYSFPPTPTAFSACRSRGTFPSNTAPAMPAQ